ncbi:hypothetical protein K1719_004385 [Acacia pycnantha]|nr:hypothetical protein K1719_004385 [Acacia pycnantha]
MLRIDCLVDIFIKQYNCGNRVNEILFTTTAYENIVKEIWILCLMLKWTKIWISLKMDYMGLLETYRLNYEKPKFEFGINLLRLVYLNICCEDNDLFQKPIEYGTQEERVDLAYQRGLQEIKLGAKGDGGKASKLD